VAAPRRRQERRPHGPRRLVPLRADRLNGEADGRTGLIRAGLGGTLAEGLRPGVVRDGAGGDAQPRVDPRLDALEPVELADEADRIVGGLGGVAGRRRLADAAQRALELGAPRRDALVAAARRGRVAVDESALARVDVRGEAGEQRR
jgi:hypothetical protein